MQKLSFWKKIVLFSPLFLFFFAHTQGVFGAIVTFERDMRVGYQGEDVRALQKILNSEPKTVISLAGPGSPGQETDYFGVKTKSAVIKFQTLYLPEILSVSVDSITATGFVGPLTRLKLNALTTGVPSQNAIVATTSTTTTTTSSKLTREEKKSADFFQRLFLKQKPTFFNVSRYEASPGMEVFINGEGFLPQGNIVHIGSGYVADSVVSNEGRTLKFTVPTDVSFGKYNLYVSNKNGDSKDFFAGDFFTITNTPHNPPSIFSINPKNISRNDINKEIIITGSGFDQKNNTIYSSLGNISNLPSSGGNLIKIKLSDFPEFTKIKSIPTAIKVSFDVVIFVKTDAGGSITPSVLSLEF